MRFCEVGELADLHDRRWAARPGTGSSVRNSHDTSGLASMLRSTSGKYAGRGPKYGTTSRTEGSPRGCPLAQSGGSD